MKNSNIRDGTNSDLEATHRLVCELADYEKEPDSVNVTVSQLKDHFNNGHFMLLVAESGNAIVGIALYYPRYSTWNGLCVYLEDLIVSQQYRGQGIGALLFEALIAKAKSLGAVRLDWQVLNWNQPAFNFYDKFAAQYSEEWTNGSVWIEK